MFGFLDEDDEYIERFTYTMFENMFGWFFFGIFFILLYFNLLYICFFYVFLIILNSYLKQRKKFGF